MTPKRVSKPSAVLSPTEAQAEVTHARDWRDERGTQRNVDGRARYGMIAPTVHGVSMATMMWLAESAILMATHAIG